MFAPGLPNKKYKRPIPSISDRFVNYVIQEHDADVAGRHYDVRIDLDDVAFSWATRKGLPGIGDKYLWIRQGDHTAEYMNYSGNIEDGYGKGSVKVVKSGKMHIISSSADKISFNIYAGQNSNTYHLINTSGDNWLAINNTATRENRPEIPSKKPKAISINLDELDIEDNNQILTPKVDGAASLFLLKKNKPIEVFSYRKSKKGPELINRTFKYPELYNTRVPKELDGTVLWGESYVSDATDHATDHATTAGLLNMNVEKAREEVKRRGLKFNNIIFNVEKYKKKDVISQPYANKVRILKEIHAKIPPLKLPALASTRGAKKALIDSIKNKYYPQTTEGWVLWDQRDSIPRKIKLKKDTELYVQDFEEGTGKYVGALGKLVATPDPEGRGPATRVGTGFSDIQRREIWKSKEKYRGLPVTVNYQNELPSGKLRMPVFKWFRTAEFFD
jgi:hypothetical protein